MAPNPYALPDPLATFLMAILFLLVGFLVLRALMLWYWKINRIVKLLEEQISVSGRIVDGLTRLSVKSDLDAAPKLPTPPWEGGPPLPK